MANTFTAPFAQTPQIGTAVCTTAGTIANDTPSNTVLLLTAGSDGCIVTRVKAMPRATVTASSLHLYVSTDGGTTQRMLDSALMAAYTQAVTTQTPKTSFSDISETAPLRLPAGARIYAQSEVALASGIVFTAEYTDF
jgi:hypothetical protein